MVTPLPTARSPQSRPPMSLVLLMVGVALLVVALHAIGFWSDAVHAITYPYGLDYGEGIIWQQAALIPGPRMYGDITQFPYIVFHYPPLYHLIVHGISALGVNMLAAGRAVSLASTLAIGCLVAALVVQVMPPRTSGRWVGGAIGGLTFFCWWPVVVWAPFMRVDMLAIALSLGGLLCVMQGTRHHALFYVGMTAFVMAVFTKQTSFAAPIAVVAVLLVVDRRVAVRMLAFGFVLGGLGLTVLMGMTHGRFLDHILFYNINRFSLGAMVQALFVEVLQLGLIVLGLLGVLAAWRCNVAARRRAALPGRDDGRFSRNLSILVLYLCLATASLVSLGKSGASLNYALEWMGVLSVLVGTLMAAVIEEEVRRARDGQRGLTILALLPLLLVLQVAVTPMSAMRRVTDAQSAELESLAARIRGADKPVLSEDMVAVMQAGKEVVWEPAIFAELASTGRWDERPFVDMILVHRFAFIVMEDESSSLTYKNRYTSTVRAAINESYPVTKVLGGKTVHLVSLVIN